MVFTDRYEVLVLLKNINVNIALITFNIMKEKNPQWQKNMLMKVEKMWSRP